MVIRVCEASEVNNLTELAVGPNHRDKITEVMLLFYGGYAPKIAYSGSVPLGSDNNFSPISCPKIVWKWDSAWKNLVGVVRDIKCLLRWASRMICMGSHLLGESFLPCLSLSLPLRATLSSPLSSRGRQRIVFVMSFRNMYGYMGLWSMGGE